MMPMSHRHRQRIDGDEIWDAVNQASQVVAPSWPIATFIARNPLMGFEDRSFWEAVRDAQAVRGFRGYVDDATFRHWYRTGRITDHDLRWAAARISSTSSDIRVPAVLSATRTLPQALSWVMLAGAEQPRLSQDSDLWQAVREHPGLTQIIPNGLVPSERRRASSVKAYTDQLVTHIGGTAQKITGWLEVQLDEELSGEKVTLAQWVEQLTGEPLVELINGELIKWCAAFLDQGQASWAMPGRERAFYRAWKQLAAKDWVGRALGGSSWRMMLDQLSDDPHAALRQHLQALGVERARWPGYLARHLAELPGWAGLIRWRQVQLDDVEQARHPIDLVQYLAVRLFYERVVTRAAVSRNWPVDAHFRHLRHYFHRHLEEYYVRRECHQAPSTLNWLRRASPTRSWRQWAETLYQSQRKAAQDDAAQRLSALFHALNWTAETVRELSVSEFLSLVDWLEEGALEMASRVWQEAYEVHYRSALLRQLAGGRSYSGQAGAPPTAQVVTCIDPRAERLRRHLERLGRYQSYGYAGFFGVPAVFRGWLSSHDEHRYPAIMRPELYVRERPVAHARQGSAEAKTVWTQRLVAVVHQLTHQVLSPFALVESGGWLWGAALLARSWPLGLGDRPRLPLKAPTAQTTTLEFYALDGGEPVGALDVEHARREHAAPHGVPLLTAYRAGRLSALSDERQADYVQKALSAIGLTQDFARIVLFLGHGARSQNNPHASALHCGAAGGYPGGVSARILATMANRPAVRRHLRARGLVIPDHTWFIAGEHNTTTDEVTILDGDDVPASHHRDVERLGQDLTAAGERTAWERGQALAEAVGSRISRTPRYWARRRSRDWAETRPEWGLAQNAAFIIGPRSLTAGLDGDGRWFLHSYDATHDPRGEMLDAILGGPLLVAVGINLEYYFSTVNNEGYGSGTKVTHNVVGQIGVMSGSASDLRTGLPQQSVRVKGETAFHEPMRLWVVIAAPPRQVAQSLDRVPQARQLALGEWFHLIAYDFRAHAFYQYRPPGHFEFLAND